MPIRLTQVHKHRSGYQPVFPQPFDFSRHARLSKKPHMRTNVRRREIWEWSDHTRQKPTEFVLPHASLRQPLPVPEVTNGRGSTKLWRPCTPAMAARLTDHVWSLKEVLLYRVPPWPQPQVR